MRSSGEGEDALLLLTSSRHPPAIPSCCRLKGRGTKCWEKMAEEFAPNYPLLRGLTAKELRNIFSNIRLKAKKEGPKFKQYKDWWDEWKAAREQQRRPKRARRV